MENAYQGAARAHALQLVGPHWQLAAQQALIVPVKLQACSSVLPQSNLMSRLCIIVLNCYGSNDWPLHACLQ